MRHPTLCLAANLPLAAAALALSLVAANAQSRAHETVLYSFHGGSDGESSVGDLVADASGALYGTTLYGGVITSSCVLGCGTVFKLTPGASGYTESVLYAFPSLDTGAEPEAGVVLDSAGAIYGTTWFGGGTVFKLTPTPRGYIEQVLVKFTGRNGQFPASALLLDRSGALYGTTSFGGAQQRGTVFKLTPKGDGYRHEILHSFGPESTDGIVPYSSLVMDANGALYGTTQSGGGYCGDWGNLGCGTVYQLTPTPSGYRERVIYDFLGFNDGEVPFAGLAADATGALYGTTSGGGLRNCLGGCGIVYKLTPLKGGYSESVIHLFGGIPSDGGSPWAGVVVGKGGALYGTTNYGGKYSCSGAGCGVVYRLTPSASGYKETILHDFQAGPDTSDPYASLLLGKDGALFGTSTQGGAALMGGVFEVTR